MPRQMPSAGFYVLNHNAYPMLNMHEVIYTTGVRGKGGHKYWRSDHNKGLPPPNNVAAWATLLWSCVPGIKELQTNYSYHTTIQSALAAY